MRAERPIDSLDSRHVMSILLFLHDQGPSKRTDIYDNVSKNSNMPDKIRKLIDLGLVEQREDIGVSLFSLTEKGMQTSEYLGRIESIMICNEEP